VLLGGCFNQLAQKSRAMQTMSWGIRTENLAAFKSLGRGWSKRFCAAMQEGACAARLVSHSMVSIQAGECQL